MIPTRRSTSTKPNPALINTDKGASTGKAAAGRRRLAAAGAVSNAEWLKASGFKTGILLLGGNSVTHFRIRVAQSQLRRDLLPSLWSVVGILTADDGFISVPLDGLADSATIPYQNGVQHCSMADYDDPARYPNIGILDHGLDPERVLHSARDLMTQRSLLDLPALMLPWLGYVWAAGDQPNPLLQSKGLPSAAFIEMVYAMVGLELTPGLAAASSCPEAIWQSALWWHEYYLSRRGGESRSKRKAPRGKYLARQQAASAVGPKDRMAGDRVVQK